MYVVIMCSTFMRGFVWHVFYFMLIVLASEYLRRVSAQNSTVLSFPSRLCPPSYHCFNNSAQSVEITLGHNGHICSTEEACYGEADPLGFVTGPRQIPRTVIQGDEVIFKPESFAVKMINVTRDAYGQCLQSGQIVHNMTSSPFEVPSEFLNPPGIKYFINYNNPLLYSCTFGIKIELYVRSRKQPNCVNASNQLGVCSGKGLCASSTEMYFTRNYTCLCLEAYQEKYCQELDSCHQSRNPCKNGATCLDFPDGIADSFNCSCPSGYTGKYCEEKIDYCRSNPCLNGSICTNEGNSYKCLCQPGFQGTNCGDAIPNLCNLEPCKNGGTCVRSGERRGNYTCNCTPYFTGRNCTVNITSTSHQFSSTLRFQTSILHSRPLIVDASSVTPRVFSTSKQILKSSNATSNVGTMSSQIMLSSSISLRASTQVTQPISAPTTVRHSSTYKTLAQSSMSSLRVLTSSVKMVSSTITTAASQVISLSQAITAYHLSTPVQRSPSLVARTKLSVNYTSTLTSLSWLLTSHVTSDLLVRSSSSSSLTSSPSSWSSSSLPSSRLSSSFFSSSSLTSPTSSRSSSWSSSSLPSSQLSSSFFSSSSLISPTSSRSSSWSSSSLPSSPLSSSPSSSSSPSQLLFSSSPKVFATSTVRQTSSVHPTPITAILFASSLLTSASQNESSPSSIRLSRLTSFFQSSTTNVSPSRSTVIISSTSVIPTLTPIIPLKNRTCANEPCLNNGTCHPEPYIGYQFRCECSYPTVGPLCMSIREGAQLHFPAFSRGSFLEHKTIAFNFEENTIVLKFKTNASEGLLLFAADHKKRGDFIQLRVTGGKLEYRFSPGDSSLFIQSNQVVNTGKLVLATAKYVMTSDPPFGTLQVDNGVELKREVQGKLKGIQLYGNWYIGGVPPGLDMQNETKNLAAPSPSFEGSIQDVQVNGEAITLAEANNWFNINEGDLPACDSKPCQNGGECIPQGENVHDYMCNCNASFTGRNCETHIHCQSEDCNGGECIPKESDPANFVCLCPLGKAGVQCKTSINITLPLFTITQNFPSFLRYPAPKQAVKSFHVSFQFRLGNFSSSNDSLLVYSAQNKFQGSGDDFFAIGLKHDKVLLHFNLGSGAARIYSDPLNKSLDWHFVVAGRVGRDGYLYVDNQPRKEGKSPGPLVGLNLFESLYIGGIPDIKQLPSVSEFKTGGFHGSIYDVAIRFSLNSPFIRLNASKGPQNLNSNIWYAESGRNVGDEKYDECTLRNPPCANGGSCERAGATFLCSCPADWAGLYCAQRRQPCYGYNPCVSGVCRPDGSSIKCDCPLGKTGQRCEQDITIQTPRFQDFSFMRFQSTNIRKTSQISIRFKAEKVTGILFYSGYHDQSDKGDFMSIYLHNGFIKLRYNLGSGTAEARSNSSIDLNEWYTVSVNREDKNATLTVSGNTTISVISPGTAVSLNVPSSFYLGGVPKLNAINPNAVDSFVQDFVGCIDMFKVNNIFYMQASTGALEGRNIANCPVSSHYALR